MSDWLKTKKGRIVYDRVPTAFKWKDAHRILAALPVPDPWDEDYIEHLSQLLGCSIVIFAKYMQIPIEGLRNRPKTFLTMLSAFFDRIVSVTDDIAGYVELGDDYVLPESVKKNLQTKSIWQIFCGVAPIPHADETDEEYQGRLNAWYRCMGITPDEEVDPDLVAGDTLDEVFKSYLNQLEVAIDGS